MVTDDETLIFIHWNNMGNTETADDHESNIEEIDFTLNSYNINMYAIHKCTEECRDRRIFEQEISEQETSEQETSEQETSEQETSEQETTESNTVKKETLRQVEQETSEQETTESNTVKKETSEQETSEQETAESCDNRSSKKKQFIVDKNGSEFKMPICYKIKTIPNQSYKDGKCGKSDKVNSICIHIASFFDEPPILYEPDKIVINDITYCMTITYPLTNPAKFTCRSDSGFTYRQVIENLVNAYNEVYRVEEETTVENVYQYAQKCTSCKTRQRYETKKCEKSDDVCSICLDPIDGNTNSCELHCGHIFHVDCIDTWLKDNTNCPQCRQNQFHKCDNCEDGQIIMEYIGKVLPIDMRQKAGQILLNRETTDGKYGIWGHDIGDLVIERLVYNTVAKELEFFIGS